MSLKGKRALVTGGSRGIGRGIALKLAEAGAQVAVHYFVNQAAAKETLERVRKHGADGILVQGGLGPRDGLAGQAFLVGVRDAAGLMSTGGRIIAITYAPAAQRAARGSRSSQWARRRRHWSRWYATSRSHSHRVASP